ncbi:Laccase-1 [Lamellibrachia satsuma]|nr:Laccase-1 [Lamellibrachia satsuma]
MSSSHRTADDTWVTYCRSGVLSVLTATGNVELPFMTSRASVLTAVMVRPSRCGSAGRWTHQWLLLLVVCLAELALGKLCVGPVCEYKFVVRRTRTMTYAAGHHVFNVALNGSRLQVVENAYRTKERYPHHIGQFVNASDVITADGFSRNVIVINEQFPGPTIEVMEGVQVVVHVTNHLLLEGTTLHFHGMHQRGTPWMDGVGYITQCPIPPRQTFTYRFEARPGGTHWYHAHFENQRIDGLCGMIIVHRRPPAVPSFPMLIADWYDDDAVTMDILSPYRAGLHRGTGENFETPAMRGFTADGSQLSSLRYGASLINGRGRRHGNPLPLETFSVVRGQRYRFRVAHTGVELPYEVTVDAHVLNVVATDGYDVTPLQVDVILINPGETVDFEISANQTMGKYWVRATGMSASPGDQSFTSRQDRGASAILLYDGINSEGDPTSTPRQGTTQHPLVVFNCPFASYPADTHRTCVSVADAKSPKRTEEQEGLADDDVIEHFLNFGFATGSSINTRRFSGPTVPFYQDYVSHSRPCSDQDCSRGCHCTHMLQLPYNRTVQLVLLNYISGKFLANHPIHVHGHGFSVVRVSYPELNATTGRWADNNNDIACADRYCAHAHWRDDVRPTLNLRDPPVKDVVNVPAKGYVVIRFRTLNPGFWFMHCHIEIHAQEGMAMIINEASERHPPLPFGFPTCGNYDIGAAGYKESIDTAKHPKSEFRRSSMFLLGMTIFLIIALAGGLAAMPFVRHYQSRQISDYNFELPTVGMDAKSQ